MTLHLHNPNNYPLPSQQQFEKLAALADAFAGNLPGELNLVFCDDEKIQQLNKDYREKDKVTDVLSFTYYVDPQDPVDGRRTPEADELVGEIFISWPQTERQATADDWSNTILDQNTPLEMEMYKLCIHGLLHIRGYDHIEDEDYRVMKLLEEKIMDSFLNGQKS